MSKANSAVVSLTQQSR